ncbi:MAG: restriction endonuclease subunit R, partial [Mucinivorans sp.]
QTREAYFEYFVYGNNTPFEEQPVESETNAEKREKLYKLVGNLVRRYVNIANEMAGAGYSQEEAADIKKRVDYYNSIKDEIKLKSGDALDLKRFDPMMRQLIDNWVRADDSEQLFEFEDISFLDLIDKEGYDAIDKLPTSIKSSERSVAETILANMYRVVNSERPNNPAYYDKVSQMLRQLLEDVRNEKLSYKELIDKLIQKVRDVKNQKGAYPASISTLGLKALYDNLEKDEELAIKVHSAVKNNAKDSWRDLSVPTKMRKVRRAVMEALDSDDDEYISKVMGIILRHKEY